MRRTQLYLDDALWNALHAKARTDKTTVSELVRKAAREAYLGMQDERRKAMQEFVGAGRHSYPASTGDATEYIRALRGGNRLERLQGDPKQSK